MLTFVFCTFALGACAGSAQTEPDAPDTFSCGDNNAARFVADGNGAGSLSIANVSYLMSRTATQTGQRYVAVVDPSIVFHDMGATASLTKADGTILPCARFVEDTSPYIVPTGAIREITWQLEDLDGQGIIDRSHLTIRFDTNSRVNGSSGCNSYAGNYTLEGHVLSIGKNLVSTMRACIANSLMEQESRFLALLPQMTSVERSEEGKLILRSPDGRSMTFRPERS